MNIDLSKSAPENCPSWDICQVNDCPLVEKPNLYQTLPEDKLLYNYHKCRCSKRKRMEIAKVFGMKSLGLTSRELAGMKQSIKMKEQFKLTQGKQDKCLDLEPSGEKQEFLE